MMKPDDLKTLIDKLDSIKLELESLKSEIAGIKKFSRNKGLTRL